MYLYITCFGFLHSMCGSLVKRILLTLCVVLLSPFQLAWISGVRLLTSLWNCFLASLSRSLYWETILASDSAVCTCGEVCT